MLEVQKCDQITCVYSHWTLSNCSVLSHTVQKRPLSLASSTTTFDWKKVGTIFLAIRNLLSNRVLTFIFGSGFCLCHLLISHGINCFIPHILVCDRIISCNAPFLMPLDIQEINYH